MTMTQAGTPRRSLAGGRNSIRAMGALTPIPVIRGREAEIAVLGEALNQAVAGRRAVVLIEGEPGIGKTRLLDAACQDARGRGVQVVSGRAEELEQTRPFGAMVDAFRCARSSRDPRRAAIGRLLAPDDAGEREPITVTSDQGLRFRVVDALADLAEDMAVLRAVADRRRRRAVGRRVQPADAERAEPPRYPSPRRHHRVFPAVAGQPGTGPAHRFADRGEAGT